MEFRYEAREVNGQSVNGVLEASSRAEALDLTRA